MPRAVRGVEHLRGAHFVFVLDALASGGAELQALLLARGLRDRHDARVSVCALRVPGDLVDALDHYGVSWRAFGGDWPSSRRDIPRMLLALNRELTTLKPDVLLPYTSRPNVACSAVWRTTGSSACIWNQRDTFIPEDVGLLWRWGVANASGFIANSMNTAEMLARRLSVARTNISVVPNGIGLLPDARSSGWRDILGIGANDFAACMVANITKAKDHRTLLHAWRRVRSALSEEGRRAVLVLAGRGDDALDDVRSVIVSLGLEGDVRLAGHVGDIQGLLECMDLGVFSSRAEGMPNGLIDSMRAGLAVVASDIPAVREAIGKLARPQVVSVGDDERFAASIIRLARDRSERDVLASWNRSRALEEFGTERFLRCSVDAIVSICERSGVARTARPV